MNCWTRALYANRSSTSYTSVQLPQSHLESRELIGDDAAPVVNTGADAIRECLESIVENKWPGKLTCNSKY